MPKVGSPIRVEMSPLQIPHPWMCGTEVEHILRVPGSWLRQLLLAHPAQSRGAQERSVPEERITSRRSQQWLRARSCAHPCLLMHAGRKKGVRAAKAPLSCLFPFCLLKPSLLFSWSQVTGLRAALGSGSSWFSLAGCGERGSAGARNSL